MTTDPGQPLAHRDGWGNLPLSKTSTPEHPGYTAPATDIEQVLCDVYAQVLGVERVGVDDSFFDLGGDSLSAMRAVAAINAALDVQVALPTLFDRADGAGVEPAGGNGVLNPLGVKELRALPLPQLVARGVPAGDVIACVVAGEPLSSEGGYFVLGRLMPWNLAAHHTKCRDCLHSQRNVRIELLHRPVVG